MIRLIYFLGFLILVSCQPKPTEMLHQLHKAPKGDAWYGGILRINEVEGFRSLYPPSVVDASSHRIIQPVYEGLIRFSAEDMSIQPCLAEKWTWDPQNLTYTFYIRRNVFFHADSCFGTKKLRTLTAQDVKFCFDRLCTPTEMNRNSYSFMERVAGAKNYYDAVVKGRQPSQGVSGIRVLSKYVLQIKLTHPYGSFLKILGTAYTRIYPPEALEYYGSRMSRHCVGTGPFRITAINTDGIQMERNTHYWQKDSLGNRLPYLDGIHITLNLARKQELLAFNQNTLDMVYGLPIEFRNHIIDSTGKLTSDYSNCSIFSTPMMTTQYYCFLMTDSLFSNPWLRKAFSMAIDRDRLVKTTLKDGALPGWGGVVPPVFEGYKVESYTYNPQMARNMLASAGYKGGKDFPPITLHISSNGTEHQQIATAIQGMILETLDIRVRIESLPWVEHLEKIEEGKFSFYRFGWQADYPDPESFLNNFYSKNIPSDATLPVFFDHSRYKSRVFDSLFVQALYTLSNTKRFQLLEAAEQHLMDDAAVIVLFYPKDYVLLKPYVENFRMNAMQIRDYAQMYFNEKKLDILMGKN